MPIFPVLSVEHNHVATVMRDAAMSLLRAAAHGAPAVATATHEMLGGVHGANLPFCAHAAVACVLGVRSYLAWRERDPERALDHALHSCASLMVAIAQLLG